MFGISDSFLHKALQVGAVPFTILTGTCTLVFYTTTTFVAANQWSAVGTPVALAHATKLRQHAATVGAGAAVSGAIGMEAVRDWLEYAKPAAEGKTATATIDQLAAQVYTTKRMFFLRPMVLATAAVGFGAALFGTGAIRFGQPDNRPAMLTAAPK
jgi:hypothetical protein